MSQFDNKRFRIVTFGCQMNEYDSDVMRGVLTARGMTEATTDDEADVVLVNTCAVRDGAEERALARLEALKGLKRKRETVLGMTGCVAQEHGAKMLERLPFLDLIIGTRDLLKVGNLVEEVWRTGERIVAVEDIDSPLSLPVSVVRRTRPLKAQVTIMLGCDKACTYCIVPKTRGREWCRPMAEVLQEVEQLIRHGFREVMLLGQNVNSYRDTVAQSRFVDEGLSAEPGVADFPVLLREVDALGARIEMETEGACRLERIRYTTSHPIDAHDALWRAMAEAPRVAPQIHLPVQSGSDRVLRRMKRLYRIADYLERLRSLRRHLPHVVISTDIIVGFCGETDEDFEQTLSLMRDVRFDSAFMFMYSPRAGTPSAEHLADDVPLETKKVRLQRLIDMQEVISEEKNRERLGSVQQVLVEGPAKYPEGYANGRTAADIIVNFPADADALYGKVVPVRITEAGPHSLRGELVREGVESALTEPFAASVSTV